MIKDQIESNENKKPNSYEIIKLKNNFPNYFDKDGCFLIEKFKNMLSHKEIDMEKEGYELSFLGKNYAKLQTSLETETVIVPDLEHNSKDENKNSENLYIVGDNVDAIKHLSSSYSNKIKCIYIDPPYNTGSDGFVYPDNFRFTKDNLAKTMGIEEDEAERILNLGDKSTHSAWLTFMYPRLMLARELLSEDGAILISIDDNENYNLRLLCNEVFGEENYIKELIVNTAEGGGNAQFVINGHEYLLAYAKNIDKFENLKREKDIRGKIVEIDGESYWIQEDSIRKVFGQYGNLHYEEILEYRDENYKKKIDLGIKNSEYILVEKDTGMHVIGKLRKISEDYSKFHSIIKHLTTNGKRDFKKVFDIKDEEKDSYFDNPKPVSLLEEVVLALTLGDKDTIVLDFFSGSATTAHATMNLNSKDNGNRKYIMVQLPEVIEKDKLAYKEGYRTIDDIGRARIEKSAKKIREETNLDIDYGYKLYRLEKPENKTLDKIIEFDPHENFIYDDMTKLFSFNGVKGRDTILYTWLNMDGYGLTTNPEKIILNQYEADIFKDTLYIIDPGLTSEDVIELIKKIEKEEINLSRIVIYPYSVIFNIIHELKKNIKNLKNGKIVNLIERY